MFIWYPAANLAATYTISTSYGSLIDKTDIGIKRTDAPDKYGPDLNKRYEGKSGVRYSERSILNQALEI